MGLGMSTEEKNKQSVDYLKDVAGINKDEAAKSVGRADIARESLRSNNSSIFQFLTILLVIVAAGSIGTAAYIIYHFYERYPGREEMTAEKVCSIFLLVAAAFFVLILGWYYLGYLYTFVRYADIFVTDLTRLTTAPESDFSFKHNLTNLISHKIGRTDDTDKAELFQNLARSVMIDPVSYLEREAEEATSDGRTADAQLLRNTSGILSTRGWGGGIKTINNNRIPTAMLPR